MTVKALAAITATMFLVSQAEAAEAACSWTVSLAGGPSAVGNVLYSVSADSTTDAWAFGLFAGPSSQSEALAEHWNGSTWSAVPTQSPSSVYNIFLSGVTLTPTDAWGIGYYANASGIYEPMSQNWNGSGWTTVSMPAAKDPGGGYMRSVAAVSGSDMWAVGHQIGPAPNYIFHTLVEHWNGATWSRVTTPNPSAAGQQLTSVVANSTTDVWAGGYVSTKTGFYRNLTIHWNGTKWSVVPVKNSGTESNLVLGMAALSSTGVFAVGEHFNTKRGGYSTLAEGWNGSSWQVQNTPNDGPLMTQLSGVGASAANGALAVGWATPTSGLQLYVPYAASWTGTKWMATHPPVPYGTYGSVLYNAGPIPGTHDFWAAGADLTSSGDISLAIVQLYQCP